MQDKILTAQNLQKRGWPHQDHCVLCNGPLETGLHLCLCCPFAKAVWDQILIWENFSVLQSQPQGDPVEIRAWWEEAAKKVPTTECRRLNGVVIYTFWNIWKREKQKNFQQYRRDGATSGRKNQGGHRAKEEGFRLRLAISLFLTQWQELCLSIKIGKEGLCTRKEDTPKRVLRTPGAHENTTKTHSLRLEKGDC